MSLAREEVIETVRDSKTSKQWRGGRGGGNSGGTRGGHGCCWHSMGTVTRRRKHSGACRVHASSHLLSRGKCDSRDFFFFCFLINSPGFCVVTTLFPLIFLSGFEGHNCENNVDDCPGHKCMNGGICVDGVNTYNCQCPPEWTGMTGFNPKLWLQIAFTSFLSFS